MSYYDEEEPYEEEEQYEEEGYYGPDEITIQSGCSFKNRGIGGVISNSLGATRNGVFTIYRRKDGKRVKIDGFETRNVPNQRMLNAVTGIPYFDGEDRNRYRVGTVDEDELFKVKFLSGENKTGSMLLFYDNPEQYERHQCVTLSTEMKEKWAERQ